MITINKPSCDYNRSDFSEGSDDSTNSNQIDFDFKDVIITATRDYNSLRIYINQLLHLEIPMQNYDGIQSWYEGSNVFKKYSIEIYRKKDSLY